MDGSWDGVPRGWPFPLTEVVAWKNCRMDYIHSQNSRNMAGGQLYDGQSESLVLDGLQKEISHLLTECLVCTALGL